MGRLQVLVMAVGLLAAAGCSKDEVVGKWEGNCTVSSGNYTLPIDIGATFTDGGGSLNNSEGNWTVYNASAQLTMEGTAYPFSGHVAQCDGSCKAEGRDYTDASATATWTSTGSSAIYIVLEGDLKDDSWSGVCWYTSQGTAQGDFSLKRTSDKAD